MRYLIVVLLVCLMTGCSWWPFGVENTGSCLDDDSCENSNPFEEQLIGGTWYCYGVDRDTDWDCSQDENRAKIAAIPDPEVAPAVEPDEPPPVDRAELNFSNELISNETPAAEIPAQVEQAPSATSSASDIFDFTDGSYAVQLIALQTVAEVEQFAADHDLTEPNYVRIRSQGSDWYVMILGVYESLDDAESVASDWTDRHQPASKPWIRRLGPLKRAALEADSGS